MSIETQLPDRMILEFERPIIDLERKISELRGLSTETVDFSAEIRRLEQKARKLQKEVFADLTAQQKVQLSRHPGRPYMLDYVRLLTEDFVELHGDRSFHDDPAIVGGMARFDAWEVLILGHQKGRDIKERAVRNFGMAYPEGYRKAMRTMELADRHGFPLVTLVDTPGAYPGIAAEQHGQGGAIARSQAAMLRLGVPSVSVVIGEGGSGGAIAIAVADRVLMQENAIYSVISPEGCASILWRDASQAKKAASAFKPDAAHCLELGVIDGIVPEPEGGAQVDHDGAAALLREALVAHLDELAGIPAEELRRGRRAKFRSMGVLAHV
jgi:acetyl-CoA carboxylase carboxyl transferase subunit alpha